MPPTRGEEVRGDFAYYESNTVDEAFSTMSKYLGLERLSFSDDSAVPLKEIHVIEYIGNDLPPLPEEETTTPESTLIQDAGSAFQNMLMNFTILAEELEIEELKREFSGAAYTMVESLSNPRKWSHKS